MDSDLTLAYSTYQRGLCEQCGYPKAMCRSDDYEWSTDTSICHAKEALENAQEPGKKPAPGELVYVLVEENTTNYGANPFTS